MTERNQNDPLDQNLNQLDEDGLLQSAFDNSKVDFDIIVVAELIQNGGDEAKIRVERNSFVASGSVAIAVCTFVAACLLFFLLGGNQENSALAWEDFRQRVNDVRSIQYVESESFPGSKKRTEYRQVMILGKHRKRVEQVRSKSLVEQLGDAVKEQAGFETDPNYSILISDLRTGKIVSLLPDQKEYTRLTHDVVVDRKGKQISKTIAQPEFDFYHRLSTIPIDATSNLGKKQVDGRNAVGYGVKRKYGLSDRSQEYWLDADTRLPVKIVISITPSGPQDNSGAQTWTLSGFKFDIAGASDRRLACKWPCPKLCG